MIGVFNKIAHGSVPLAYASAEAAHWCRAALAALKGKDRARGLEERPSLSGRFEIHADIHGGGRLGDTAYRNVIHAGLGNGADGVHINATRCL